MLIAEIVQFIVSTGANHVIFIYTDHRKVAPRQMPPRSRVTATFPTPCIERIYISLVNEVACDIILEQPHVLIDLGHPVHES